MLRHLSFILVLFWAGAAFARAGEECPAIYWGPSIGPEKPMIAIVIDDMGVAPQHTRQALDLPAFVTFAFLPYADHVDTLASRAVAAGHEVIVHIPMQAQASRRHAADPGPDHLSLDENEDALRASIQRNLKRFSAYIGVNNHMGSAFTQNFDAMTVLMAELKKRNLFFLDSVTTPKTISARAARLYGVPYVSREVFIDHVDDPAAIDAALKEAERLSRRKGMIVIIGHPRPHTLAALQSWIPAAQKRGANLVPLSEIVRRKNAAMPFAALEGFN